MGQRMIKDNGEQIKVDRTEYRTNVLTINLPMPNRHYGLFYKTASYIHRDRKRLDIGMRRKGNYYTTWDKEAKNVLLNTFRKKIEVFYFDTCHNHL